VADPVVVVDYDASWPATFHQLEDQLAATLGPLAVAIEHVGSTAVLAWPQSRSSTWTW
jgi:GrpB-like predicted nucleotidyltransferase (UPF0157 family)